jgi:hypothetical protein
LDSTTISIQSVQKSQPFATSRYKFIDHPIMFLVVVLSLV